MVVAGGCDRTPSVTVYASADESVARPVFERFEKETGIRVDAKFDTEATKTTGLAQTLRAERDRPRADVFWSNEQAAHVSLAMDGITAPMVDSGVGSVARCRRTMVRSSGTCACHRLCAGPRISAANGMDWPDCATVGRQDCDG
jgi:hypothetical protein